MEAKPYKRNALHPNDKHKLSDSSEVPTSVRTVSNIYRTNVRWYPQHVRLLGQRPTYIGR